MRMNETQDFSSILDKFISIPTNLFIIFFIKFNSHHQWQSEYMSRYAGYYWDSLSVMISTVLSKTTISIFYSHLFFPYYVENTLHKLAIHAQTCVNYQVTTSRIKWHEICIMKRKNFVKHYDMSWRRCQVRILPATGCNMLMGK